MRYASCLLGLLVGQAFLYVRVDSQSGLSADEHVFPLSTNDTEPNPVYPRQDILYLESMSGIRAAVRLVSESCRAVRQFHSSAVTQNEKVCATSVLIYEVYS